MSDEDWDNEDTSSCQQSSTQNYEARGGSRSYYDSNAQQSRFHEGNRYSDDRKRNDRQNHEFSESVDIRSDQIGQVIGRAGANIKRLQSDFNVHVNVDKNRNVVVVSGDSSTQVRNAIDEMKSKFTDNERGLNYSSERNYSRENNSRGGRDRFERHDNKREKYDGRSDEPAVPLNEEGMIDWDKLNAQADECRKIRWEKCPKLTKNFYRECEEVANLSKEQIEKLRLENNNITVARVFEQADTPENDIPNPIWKFEHCFADYPDLMDELKKMNFEKPSPIQCQAWPVLLKGEDLIGIAQTGTGKTLAFLLPGMIHTDGQSIPRGERGGPNVLIMAPTRELALQIEKEVNKYSFRNMKAVCVYGGGNRREQIGNVEKGVEIIICTPGRLNDLIEAKVIDVSSVTYLVLDEADRMLDMGFEPQIRKVLLDIRPDRQTVMTSATWPPGVRRLAQSYMSNPIQVCVGSLDLAATQTVKQVIEICDEDDKEYLVRKFIKNMAPDDKVIIFMGKKTRADDLSSDLTIEGFLCTAIHGSREQSDREQAIADITSGDIRILIATDVASRGLDIEDITHVINYDFPRNIEEYVHRVGRTGRAGRTGTSISFVTRSDWGVAKELINILEKGDMEVPEELRQMADRFKAAKERQAAEGGRFGRGGRGGGGGGGYRSHRY